MVMLNKLKKLMYRAKKKLAHKVDSFTDGMKIYIYIYIYQYIYMYI